MTAIIYTDTAVFDSCSVHVVLMIMTKVVDLGDKTRELKHKSKIGWFSATKLMAYFMMKVTILCDKSSN